MKNKHYSAKDIKKMPLHKQVATGHNPKTGRKNKTNK